MAAAFRHPRKSPVSPLAPVLATTSSDTARVFREHAAYVWRVLRRLGVEESDVEDVCQEVFVIVHKKLGTFEGRSSLRTWVYGICLRSAADYRKRSFRRNETVTEAFPDVPSGSDPHGEAAGRQARALLDRIVGELDDEKRAVFVLYEIEELPMSEVAAAIGCPVQTAYSRLHAARAIVEKAAGRLGHVAAPKSPEAAKEGSS
jgi:RNA polymerase sigma-70 factor (ECF subfamily)